MGIIYCLTSPSGKKYIGQTTRSFEKRLHEHSKVSKGCIALNNAIAKYGFDTFEKEVLLTANDALLDYYEKRMIDAYDSIYPNGYNIRTGGSYKSHHCEESRKRMSQSKIGDKNPNFGKTFTAERCDAISKAKAGEKHHFFGKTLSFEHKLNLSVSHKKDVALPIYLVKIKARPERYCSDGYAVVNHPTLCNKYFTSKKLSDSDKFSLATKYLESGNMDAVQRLNGDGSSIEKA
jgi:group I intron endonuclease